MYYVAVFQRNYRFLKNYPIVIFSCKICVRECIEIEREKLKGGGWKNFNKLIEYTTVPIYKNNTL